MTVDVASPKHRRRRSADAPLEEGAGDSVLEELEELCQRSKALGAKLTAPDDSAAYGQFHDALDSFRALFVENKTRLERGAATCVGFRSLLSVLVSLFDKIKSRMDDLETGRAMFASRRCNRFGNSIRQRLLTVRELFVVAFETMGDWHKIEGTEMHFSPGAVSKYEAALLRLNLPAVWSHMASRKEYREGIRQQLGLLVTGLASMLLALETFHPLPADIGFMPAAGWYILSRRRAAEKLAESLKTVKVEMCRRMWSWMDERVLGSASVRLIRPFIAIDRTFEIPALPVSSSPRAAPLKPRFPDQTFERLCPKSTFPFDGSVPVPCLLLSEVPYSIQLPGTPGPGCSCMPSAPRPLPGRSLSDTVILHAHGGGFVAMSPFSHSMYTRVLSKDSGYPLFSLDYRKSPEARFPAALEDMYTAYRWLLANPERAGWTGKRIVLSGDSCGGNLAAALILRLIAEGQRIPDAAVLEYPVTYVAEAVSPSRLLSCLDPMLNSPFMRLSLQAYLGENLPRGHENMYISPLLAPSAMLAHFPETLIVVGDMDPLLDDSVAFHQRLVAAGAKSELRVLEGFCHGWMNMSATVGECRREVEALARWIARPHGAAGPAAASARAEAGGE